MAFKPDGKGHALKDSSAKLDPVRAAGVKLPDGRAISALPAHELKRAALELGIPGVDGSTGHQAVADAYCEHLARIHADAGKRAVDAWLAAARQPARLEVD